MYTEPGSPVTGSGLGSTATSAGAFSRVRLLLLPGSPHVGCGELGLRSAGPSQTPLVPICSSICDPSWVHFWTTPSEFPAIQMLSISSVAQPWMPWGSTAAAPAGVRAGSPQLPATLPSVSYRMTGGEGIDCEPSCGSRPPGRKPRLTVMTWSCESMQFAPTMPVTHWRARPSASVIVGNGRGQKGSTRYSGAVARVCVCASGMANQDAPAARAASSAMAGRRRTGGMSPRRLRVMACPDSIWARPPRRDRVPTVTPDVEVRPNRSPPVADRAAPGRIRRQSLEYGRFPGGKAVLFTARPLHRGET